jgi:diguanylate cyclase (GGDEF)-like protein
MERLKLALIRADNRDDYLFAVIFLDLDRFKIINGSLGHGAGDKLLIETARRLEACVKSVETVARVGGDEFAALLFNMDADQAHSIATQVIESAGRSVVLQNARHIYATISIGIALFPDHGRTPETLLAYADLAMYRAKEEGRNRACIYASNQKTKIESRLNREKQIRDAVDQRRFVLHLQPLVNLINREIIGYEGLLRMGDGNGSLIYPSDFLDVAAHCGLMHEIERWVISTAIELIAEMQKAGKHHYIGVNLSGKAFIDPALPSFISQKLASSAINPENLVFEISEKIAVANIVEVQCFVNALKAMGCRFALDDFGKSISSLNYLKYLPVDYLKIDGGFICDLPNNPVDKHLVKAIVEIANTLKKQTIAAFVECEETIELLRECGVNYIQGHHIGRPQAVSEILDIPWEKG